MATKSSKKAVTSLDPITFEIIRNRLISGLTEAGITLIRTSGSEVTFASRDYAQAYYTNTGALLYCAPANLLHVFGMANLVTHLLAKYGKEGVHEGDQFVFSEPYLAGMHAPDVAVVTPIYWEGECVAFCASLSHQAEIGAVDPGGFCPRASESYHEGFRMVGLRVMTRGERVEGAFDTMRNMVRIPEEFELEILAKVAANNVLIKRYQELVARFGAETMEKMDTELIDYSERLSRERLREMADGTWTSVTYLDHDGSENNIYRIPVKAVKKGDELLFDFTGAAKMAPTFVNATLQCAMGCAFSVLASRLFWDVPWNEGLMRAVKLDVPEGCIINAQFPAPVSGGMPAGGGVNVFAVQDVLSKMMLASPKYRSEAAGVFGYSAQLVIAFGTVREGNFYAWVMMECMSGGMGGRTYSDGVDTGLSIQTPRSTISNVEQYEALYPALLLYRREKQDSGGPGQFRGGVGGEMAMVIRGSGSGYMDCVLASSAIEPALAVGLAGGYPAGQGQQVTVTGSDVFQQFEQNKLPTDLSDISGTVASTPAKGYVRINEGDVFYFAWHGGGGFGDPLDREADLVQRDVVEGRVSGRIARDTYGVVLGGDGAVNVGETQALREQIRQERLAARSGVKHGKLAAVPAESDTRVTVLENVQIFRAADGTSHYCCRQCDHVLGPADQNFKIYAEKRVFSYADMVALGLLVADSDRFVIREFFCPGCGAMFDVESVLRDEDYLDTRIDDSVGVAGASGRSG